MYSTRINQKIKNVEVENKLSKIVEPLNFYLGEKYSNHIEEAYKTLIKNHAHDSICGCSLDSVARAVDMRLEKCEQTANSILKHIIYDFRQNNHIHRKVQDKIGLFNLTNENNLKVVKIKLPYVVKNAQVIAAERGFEDKLLANCYKIPVTENIKDIYTQLVEIGPNRKMSFNTVKILRPRNTVNIENNLIENFNIGLYVKNNEIILEDRKKHKELKLKITDVKDEGDTYNFAPSGERETLPLIRSEILYKGNIECALRLYFKDIELDAILNSYSKFIRFRANINNKEENHKLQIVVLFKEDIKKTIAQDAIGIVDRTHEPFYKMEDYMPTERPFELQTNSYPMQNFVCANGFIALTKGLQEYETYKNELRICLLRCVGIISNPNNPARSIPAGPALFTPMAQMKGENKAEFAFLFGDEAHAFSNLDEFMENYVTIMGAYKKDVNFTLDKFDDECYFYGISEGKKILYNYKKDKISLV